MTVYIHKLAGCKPTPLAHYLKALGVLRLVATQVDPTARGCFREDTFLLVSTLDAAALMAFFLEHYEPTPIIAPWNNGSGFYKGERKREAIDALRRSKAGRFARYREAISVAANLVAFSRRPATLAARE